ncbi:MAG: 16S rRNA (cytosine(1402)-N(4))-methyltransferase RsmH [Deltaproteobacteria bacterium]|nr:16S rRNA (cytosine(1402)-N(4))-methyltransferase RsmH [Deltaproteobacteria bacterium]
MSCHVPVLLGEVLEFLQPKPGGVYFDGTFGGGGHTQAILKASSPNGMVIASDRDDSAVARGALHFSDTMDSRLKLFCGRFDEVGSFFQGKFDGALLDLGISSDQIMDEKRGFSFMREGHLDMRMDLTMKTTAADLINHSSEAELIRILSTYGEEHRSKRLARAFVEHRRETPFRSTKELVRVVEKVKGRESGHLHPATKTFQALRIAVNQELDFLRKGVEPIVDQLAPGGRLCVISFHSLEDRIVKETFRRLSGLCRCPEKIPLCVCNPVRSVRVLTKKPVKAGREEMAANPRSRSAKLRVVERI